MHIGGHVERVKEVVEHLTVLIIGARLFRVATARNVGSHCCCLCGRVTAVVW